MAVEPMKVLSVDKHTFLATILAAMRGVIVAVRPAYPDVLHLEFLDQDGRVWRFATQDADWSPHDPETLVGQQIREAQLDDTTGVLRWELSNGGAFEVRPSPQEAGDDPPNWVLLGPEGLSVEFGPGSNWQVARSARNRRDPQALTSSERRVAALLGSGKSNLEIAESLHITQRAVEDSLERITSKLGIVVSPDSTRRD